MKKLKLIRMSRSLTQLDVEAGTSISNCRLSFLENGRRSPTDKELEALAKFYGVSVEAILGDFVLDSAGSANA